MRREYDFSHAKRGAVLPSAGKTRITIMLDDDVIEFFRARAEAQGVGYQTMIHASLRAAVAQMQGGKQGPDAEDGPVTLAALRKILREELKAG